MSDRNDSIARGIAMTRVDQVEDEVSSEQAREARGSRDSMFLQAVLRLGHGSEGTPIPVRVRNISAGGLMVEPVEPLDRGEPVSIDLRGIGIVDGHVAWAMEGRMGIAFLRPIDPKMTRQSVKVSVTPVYTPPIVASRRPGLRVD